MAHLPRVEGWVEAELACGRPDALVPQLQAIITEYPTRERLWEQLMIALYRTGRQDAALAAFRNARVTLDRELGVTPSDRLQRCSRRSSGRTRNWRPCRRCARSCRAR